MSSKELEYQDSRHPNTDGHPHILVLHGQDIPKGCGSMSQWNFLHFQSSKDDSKARKKKREKVIPHPLMSALDDGVLLI